MTSSASSSLTSSATVVTDRAGTSRLGIAANYHAVLDSQPYLALHPLWVANSLRAGTLAERVFCCAGCLGAYQLIQGWGLEDFYALADQMKLTGAAQAAGKGNRYEQFDRSRISPGRLRPLPITTVLIRAESRSMGCIVGRAANG